MNKQFLTIDGQISKIKSNGISIKDELETKKTLQENSYYNIINGYRTPFLHLHDSKTYLHGTEFMEIYALYHFDRQLRDHLLSYLLEAENMIKTQVVYAFLNSQDSSGKYMHEDDAYLRIESYEHGQNKRNLKLIAQLQRLISDSFESSDSITHYLSTYSYVPLWVLSTRWTFGDVCNFYASMTSQDRQAVSSIYKIPDDKFLTIINILSFVRNHCAHGNRVYCIRKLYDFPVLNPSLFPVQNRFGITNHGKHNLLNVFLALKTILSEKRYKELLRKTERDIETLSSRINVIGVTKITDIMGIPYPINAIE